MDREVKIIDFDCVEAYILGDTPTIMCDRFCQFVVQIVNDLKWTNVYVHYYPGLGKHLSKYTDVDIIEDDYVRFLSVEIHANEGIAFSAMINNFEVKY